LFYQEAAFPQSNRDERSKTKREKTVLRLIYSLLKPNFQLENLQRSPNGTVGGFERKTS